MDLNSILDKWEISSESLVDIIDILIADRESQENIEGNEISKELSRSRDMEDHI